MYELASREDETHALVTTAPTRAAVLIERWLEVKSKISAEVWQKATPAQRRSVTGMKTRAAYGLVMCHFREALAHYGLDLFADLQQVGLVASSYVHTSYDRRGRVQAGKLSESTINQRIAILTSFYSFAHTIDAQIDNPISCKREKRQTHDAATFIDAHDVQAILTNIETTTLAGKRDYALLLLAVTTGRRANELVALTWGDLHLKGKGIEVTWRHCKGNKTMQDVLGVHTRKALERYLHALYGEKLGTLDTDTPVFVSLSRNHDGGMISTQTASDICKKYLGTSKVHTTRHTFAINLEQAGASLSEIGEKLGHSSLKTTSDYMKRLHSAENKHINKLEELYGFSK